MKRIYNFILLVCLVQLAVAQNRIAEIRENLLGNYSDRVLVVSHRADWRNAPENSLQGIQNCIDMGVDMVEIDLKKTKDGHLVVMHDKTINRTMTGKGNAGGLYTGRTESNAYLKMEQAVKPDIRFLLSKK